MRGNHSCMTSLSCTACLSEVVIASAWNANPAYRMGVMVGNEAIDNGVSSWGNDQAIAAGTDLILSPPTP